MGNKGLYGVNNYQTFGFIAIGFFQSRSLLRLKIFKRDRDRG